MRRRDKYLDPIAVCNNLTPVELEPKLTLALERDFML